MEIIDEEMTDRCPIKLLVFLVFGTLVSTGYVTAILFLIQFKSTDTKAVSLETFYTCCMSCLLLAVHDTI